MECKYIFFDWGYTLISKFENVDDKINKNNINILEYKKLTKHKKDLAFFE